MQNAKVEKAERFYHYVVNRNWWWAYSYFRDDIEQEARICAFQYGSLDEREYRNKCYKSIRSLLSSYGYHEAYKKFERCIEIPRESEGIEKENVPLLKIIEKMYQSGMDYINICKAFGIKDMDIWLEVRHLLRVCFAKTKRGQNNDRI